MLLGDQSFGTNFVSANTLKGLWGSSGPNAQPPLGIIMVILAKNEEECRQPA